MKIVADAHIPFVAECLSSIGEVVKLPAQNITPDNITDADGKKPYGLGETDEETAGLLSRSNRLGSLLHKYAENMINEESFDNSRAATPATIGVE